ncbi:MAG: RNA degradosome polyphosphate kinase [Bacillota bacterium]
MDDSKMLESITDYSFMYGDSDNSQYMGKKYINRELSWLEFNSRVLEEAQDKKNMLLERTKFLSIVSSNLDEFFMVRVASLKDQVHVGLSKHDISGMSPSEQLKRISLRAHNMVHEQYNCYNRSVIPALSKEGISFLKIEELNKEQLSYVDGMFENTLFPVLTPMAVDKSRPFPLILNKSLNIALLLENQDSEQGFIFATVQVPSILDRVIRLPGEEESYILLENVIQYYINRLFRGHSILCTGKYRITRNADLSIDEEGAEDLLSAIEKSVKKRKWGSAIRLEVDYKFDQRLLSILKEELELRNEDIYYINGDIDLTFLMKFNNKLGEKFNYLRNEVLVPVTPVDLIGSNDIFEAIAQKDILLHHPFESFDYVIDFIRTAASDPNVLAIKQTLYRVSGNSPIVNALAEAAENGKQVTVLLELKARFDEENNINWAKQLEQSGCHVIYGLVGLKTHCKMTLVVRSEEEGIKRYVHLSTGNYNDITARLYTDIGFMTANPYIAADTSAIFNMLSGYSQLDRLYKMEVAPIGLRKRFIELIKHEAKNARQGKEAAIIAKMNSLVDDEIIDTLYEASQAGVNIQLIVRGICCLRPGVKGLSENIKVTSIVDRFLEHSRIYYFHNSGAEQIYLSSADWMYRNMDRRVEVIFPIEDKHLIERVKEILDVILMDTVKARVLNSDGTYSHVDKRGKKHIQSQLYLYDMIKSQVEELKGH